MGRRIRSSQRKMIKWCKNSIELSGFSGVGGSLSGGDRLEGSRPDVGGVGPVVLVRHAERIGSVHVDMVDQRGVRVAEHDVFRTSMLEYDMIHKLRISSHRTELSIASSLSSELRKCK